MNRVREHLRLVPGYHSPQVDVRVRLNTNESPEPPPPAFADALRAEIERVDFNRYPDRGAHELRAAIAEMHGVEPEQVWCGNGSNEVLQAMCLAFGGPGATAVTFEPTYPLHGHIARITATAVESGTRDEHFRVVAGELDRLARDASPALTFLCSPNNPTGNVEPRALVEHALDVSPGLVVVDEAYGQFSSWSALELVGDDRALVVVRTFSKTWSLAALRLGYAIAPREVVAGVESVTLPYHLDAVKQAAGRVALQFRGEMEDRVARLVTERERLVAALRSLPVHVWPSEANFVLFRPEAAAADDVWQDLVDRSVLVRNCASWPHLSNCLRVTVGTPQENDAFLSALGEVLA